MKETIKIQSFLSPCGELSLGSYGGKLCLCNWQNSRRREAVEKRISRYLQAEFENGESDITDKTARQLNEYFEGKRTKFNIPLLLVGTDFQQLVWNGLLKICFGQKCSYADLARQINSPNAVRAVANANAVNAVSILVPCHRVIGSDNRLTGYGGGLSAKQYLLDLEQNKN